MKKYGFSQFIALSVTLSCLFYQHEASSIPPKRIKQPTNSTAVVEDSAPLTRQSLQQNQVRLGTEPNALAETIPPAEATVIEDPNLQAALLLSRLDAEKAEQQNTDWAVAQALQEDEDAYQAGTRTSHEDESLAKTLQEEEEARRRKEEEARSKATAEALQAEEEWEKLHPSSYASSEDEALAKVLQEEEGAPLLANVDGAGMDAGIHFVESGLKINPRFYVGREEDLKKLRNIAGDMHGRGEDALFNAGRAADPHKYDGQMPELATLMKDLFSKAYPNAKLPSEQEAHDKLTVWAKEAGDHYPGLVSRRLNGMTPQTQIFKQIAVWGYDEGGPNDGDQLALIYGFDPLPGSTESAIYNNFFAASYALLNYASGNILDTL